MEKNILSSVDLSSPQQEELVITIGIYSKSSFSDKNTSSSGLIVRIQRRIYLDQHGIRELVLLSIFLVDEIFQKKKIAGQGLTCEGIYHDQIDVLIARRSTGRPNVPMT